MTRLFWIVALVLATNLCSAAPPLPRDALHERRSLILSQRMLNKVLANAVSISNQSWEYGTLLEAMTEFQWPSLSVYSGLPVNPRAFNSRSEHATDVVALATQIVNNKAAGELPLIDGAGATGDPASIGTGVLLANWTTGNQKLGVAATEQLEYLLTHAPRSSNGLISQRVSQVQAWADAVYMFPPFLAYYGALQSDYSLLYESYRQVRLYRETLLDPKGSGLWRHIQLGTKQDASLWGTGNGWVAMGMMRVLQTIADSDFSAKMKGEQQALELWISDLLTATWKHQGPNGTLFNYINETHGMSDTSTTAMMAAATYRLASFNGNVQHIAAADKAYELIYRSVDSDGWLLNAVDPLLWNVFETPGVWSPEAQSFVILLHSAYVNFHRSQ